MGSYDVDSCPTDAQTHVKYDSYTDFKQPHPQLNKTQQTPPGRIVTSLMNKPMMSEETLDMDIKIKSISRQAGEEKRPKTAASATFRLVFASSCACAVEAPVGAGLVKIWRPNGRLFTVGGGGVYLQCLLLVTNAPNSRGGPLHPPPAHTQHKHTHTWKLPSLFSLPTFPVTG